MRRLIVLATLCAVGCGSSPVAPAQTYHATLTATNPIIGVCALQCAFTSVVTNTGPDCATGVGMSITVTAAPLFPVMGIGASFAGVLRPGQSVQVSGSDWPKGAILITSAAGNGQPIACP